MKKRNIGICIITTTLLMGGPAKATELILAKDHTNVVNQAAEIAAYKSNRPPNRDQVYAVAHRSHRRFLLPQYLWAVPEHVFH